MEYLTQSFSNLAWLGQDSWECDLGFIASKHSLNPEVAFNKTLLSSRGLSFLVNLE
jgi:hypothetical protein